MSEGTIELKPSLVKKKRDFQRSRLYAAQECLFPAGLHGRLFDPEESSYKQVQTYVDSVLASGWFKERWPYINSVWVINSTEALARAGLARKDVNINSPKEKGTVSDQYVLKIPHWARTERLILHELAHICTFGDRHGKIFAGVLIELIRYWMGQTAALILERAFEVYGVRWTPYEVGASMPIQAMSV